MASKKPESVLNLLVNRTCNDKKTRGNLIEATQKIDSLTFVKFDKILYNEVLEGIKLHEFKDVLKKVGSVHNMPDEQMTEILLGANQSHHDFSQNEFAFNTAKTEMDNSIVYCKGVTLKQSDELIDLAMMFYSLDFDLSPKAIPKDNVVKFLGFIPVGHYTTLVYEPKILSIKDQDYFTNFFRSKALQGLLMDHPEAGNEFTEDFNI